MYSAHKIQLIILFSSILFMYSLMAIQYHIWKFSDNKPVRPKTILRPRNKKTEIANINQTMTEKPKGKETLKILDSQLELNSKVLMNKMTLQEHSKLNGYSNEKVYEILLWENQDKIVTKKQKFNFGTCGYSNCKSTQNKSRIKSSDAVVISLKYITKGGLLPKYRTKHQKWILLNTHSPDTLNMSIAKYNSIIFNATAGYKQSSDIYLPYGEVKQIETPTKHSHYNHAKGKTKLAAIVSDHCNSSSKRETYIRELKKHIPIDTYGSCGNLSCHNKINGHRCLRTIANNYKFILAFETSLCQDYVTETLWQVIDMNVIPVVLGQANYSDILPPHSYVNVQDFQSPVELAQFLKVLDKHDELYNGYFLWKKYHNVQLTLSFSNLMCKLCEYMNKSEGREGTFYNIKDLWNKDNQCVTEEEFYKKIMFKS